MSATKRRQIDKSQTAKQTQIPFVHTKMPGSEMTMADKVHFQKMLDKQSMMYDYNNGAKDSKSPFRSNKRINMIMKTSPSFSQCGFAKNMETPSVFQLNLQRNSSSFMSKPSSVTTACTYAPNDYSVSKNDFSQKTRREPLSDKKQSNNKKLVGQKRQNESDPEQMEYLLRLHSKAAKHVLNKIKLTNKKTGQVIQFSMVDEKSIEALRNPLITDFDTTKLEIEYDYDTDCEQMTQSKKMLFEELKQAIDFFIKEDPLKLVDNIFL